MSIEVDANKNRFRKIELYLKQICFASKPSTCEEFDLTKPIKTLFQPAKFAKFERPQVVCPRCPMVNRVSSVAEPQGGHHR